MFFPGYFQGQFLNRSSVLSCARTFSTAEGAREAKRGVFHLRLIPDLGSGQIQLEVPSAVAVPISAMLWCISPKFVQHKSQRAASLPLSMWEFLLQSPPWWWEWRRERIFHGHWWCRAGFGMATACQYVDKMYFN